MERADAAEKHLREELAKLPNTEVRFATVKSGITSSEDGTRAWSRRMTRRHRSAGVKRTILFHHTSRR